MFKKTYSTLVIIGLVAAASIILTRLFEDKGETDDKADDEKSY